MVGSSFGRRAINSDERYSTWPWNSVRSSKCCPFLDSGSGHLDEHYFKGIWNGLTSRIIFIHPDHTLLVAGHNGHLPVREKEIDSGNAYTSHILGKDDELVWVLLSGRQQLSDALRGW